VLVVDIGHDADDAPWARTDIDELHHRISPHHMAIDRFLRREHSLRNALTDDDDRFAALAVRLVEIASGDQRDAKRREIPWRDRTEGGAWIFFARRANVSISRKLEPRAEATRVTIRGDRADCDAFNARQLCDAPHRLLVEIVDLFASPSIRDHWHIQH